MRSFGSLTCAKIAHATTPSASRTGCCRRKASSSLFVASHSVSSFARFALPSSSSASLFASVARISRISRSVCTSSKATGVSWVGGEDIVA
eukprot:29346-Pelagococcus_subviridis.AAC.4